MRRTRLSITENNEVNIVIINKRTKTYLKGFDRNVFLIKIVTQKFKFRKQKVQLMEGGGNIS